MDIFTVMNIAFVLTPLIAIDLYGCFKYNWGGQFYVVIIETIILSVAILPITIYDMVKLKRIADKAVIVTDSMALDPNENVYERVV